MIYLKHSCCPAVLILLIATIAALKCQVKATESAAAATENQHDLSGSGPSSKNETSQEGRSIEGADGRTVKKAGTGGRAGRMMDLDVLVGAIGKDEKLAKERSMSGHRQSRILSEDIGQPQQPAELTSGRSLQKKTGGGGGGGKKSKKMTIKGFIPIVSVENHQMASSGGSPFDTDSEDSEAADNESRDEANQQQQQQQQQQPTREQLLSGYGGQTSMGHASFVSAPTAASEPQQWNSMGSQSDMQPEAARARKLIHGTSSSGSLLSGLSAAPRRLISTLVPQQQQHHQSLQAPMNLPLASYQQSAMMDSMQQQQGECICVPFFQCRNGYLSPNQLSKSQLAQLAAGQQSQPILMPANSMYQQQHQQQVPRALKNVNDLYYTTNGQISAAQNSQPSQQQQQLQYDAAAAAQQHQAISSLSPGQANNAEQQQQQQQLLLQDAYEQLKKTMESENLEQLLLQQQQQQQQQMMNLPLLDERSKSGASQQLDSSSTTGNSSASEDSTASVQERSLLTQLAAGRRSSQFNQMAQLQQQQQPQRSCGIMRTCCKVPASLAGPSRPLPMQAPRLVQPQSQQLHGSFPQHNHYSSHSQRPAETAAAAADYQPHANLVAAQSQFIQQQLQPQAQFTQQSQFIQQQPSQLMGGGGGGGFMAGRCGLRQALGVAGRVQNVQPAPGSESSAEFGEFPAHAAILKRLGPADSLFVCSAVLISSQWLATAAHCVRKLRADELKVRLGEWDVQRDDEFYPFVELNVRQILVHPDFQPSSLINDLALLRLDSAAGLDLQQMPHVAPACLATPAEQFAGQRCWLAGWGKDAFGTAGAFQSVLKKVDLPVMERHQCESALKHQTKLGKFFRLHSSALCAGGERGKDACEGDGGAGLYCADPQSGLTKAVGLVSWGVGCGQVGVPGIYTNLAQFYGWIEGSIASSGEENLYPPAAGANSIPDHLFSSLVSERSAAAAANGTTHTGVRQPNKTPLPPSTDEKSSSSSSKESEQTTRSPLAEQGVESRAGRR